MSNIPCPMDDSGAFDCAFDMTIEANPTTKGDKL